MKLRAIVASAFLLVLVCASGLFTLSCLRPPMAAPIRPAVDLIVVEKAAHRMTLFKEGHAIRTYAVALGRGGLGKKQMAGDNKVPEGRYRITGRNPHSAYHLSLRIGYPTPEQVADARRRGIDPGSNITIHGITNGLGWIGALHRRTDWTRGCIAVTDPEIEEIWRMVPDGTPIVIKP